MRIISFIVIVLTLFTLVLFGTGRQVYLWLKTLPYNPKPLGFTMIFGFFWLSMIGLFIYSRVPHNPLPRIIHSINHYALGLFAYLAMSFLLVGLLLFLVKLMGLSRVQIDRLRYFAGFLALIVTLGFFIYGSLHAKKLITKEYFVELQKEGASSQELKILLLSDLHLGYIQGEKEVRDIVGAINKQEPDLVVMVGDIFDGDIHSIKNPKWILDLLRDIHAPHGVYASLGNHDAGSSFPQMVDFLKEANITLLMDEYIILENQLLIAGRRDSSPIGDQGSKREPLILPLDNQLPVIVLDHQPGNTDEYGKEVDLLLSGHTHRGQLFPFQWITSAVYEVDYGYYRRDETSPHVIVSSGVGTWGPPLRTSSDNEIVIIHLSIKSPIQP